MRRNQEKKRNGGVIFPVLRSSNLVTIFMSGTTMCENTNLIINFFHG